MDTHAHTELQHALDGILQATKEIHDVAAKTKLLGFNAAIVAAQAGEQGKSFAVVAEQMKALNLRSLAAAKTLSERTQALVRAMAAHDAQQALDAGPVRP